MTRRLSSDGDVAGKASEKPCGLGWRLPAVCYDGLLLVSILILATFPLLALTGGEAIHAGTWWYDGYLLGLCYLYFTWQWTHGGQTLGMRAWRIRLRLPAGGPPGWSRASIRFGAAVLSWLPLGLGFLWAIRTPGRRTFHDRLSGTVLTRYARGQFGEYPG